MVARSLTVWMFAALLAVASAGLSLARHAPMAAGYLSLCTAAGETIVAVDARGEPVTPGHPCADCTLALAALLPAHAAPLRWTTLETRAVPARAVFPARAETGARAHPPRGPPLPV
jgi:hypothetical protein